MFHKTFLRIIRGKDSLDKIYNKLEGDGVSAMNFDILPKNVDTVITSAPFLLQSIKREQQLIETNKDYYVARDILTNTFYICYNNVLMLDLDTTSNIDDVLTKLEQETDKCFSIYKSHNGYHIFCLSHRFEYRDKRTCDFMLKYAITIQQLLLLEMISATYHPSFFMHTVITEEFFVMTSVICKNYLHQMETNILMITLSYQNLW